MTFGQIGIMSDKDLVFFYDYLLARSKQTNLIQFFQKKYGLESSFIFYGGFQLSEFLHH